MGKGQDSNCAPSLRLLVGGKREAEEILAGIRSLEIPGSFLVGGCVRDMLWGQEPKDWDLMACGISKEELIPYLQKRGTAEELRVAGQLVGARFHADWTPPDGIEIALPRTESSTGPGHDQFQIQPIDLPPEVARLPLEKRTSNWSQVIQEDARRRDFTCNTLLHDIHSGDIIDPTGQGLADLENKILRTVSPESFRDDPLRILRGLARVSRDGMSFDPDTEEQARRWIGQANHTSGTLSAERVQGELIKILSGSNSTGAFEILRDWEAIDSILPGWGSCVGFDQQSRYHNLDVDQHIFQALRYADQAGYSPSLKMAVLLHDIGKPATAKPGKDGHLHYYQADRKSALWQEEPTRAKAHEAVGADMARDILNGLRYPEREKEQIVYLVQHHMFSEERDFANRPIGKQENLARKMLYKHGLERSESLLELRACDLNGKMDSPGKGWDQDIRALENMLQTQKHQPHRLDHLSLDGKDLIDLGVRPGPQVGEVLQQLLKQVVGDPEANQPERLRRIAQGIIQASAE